MIFRISTLFFMLIFSAVSLAENNQQVIEVSGRAAINAVPDSFELTIYIKERQASVAKAKQLVDHKSNLVVSAAQQLSISKRAINSAQVAIQPIYQKVKVPLKELELPVNEGGVDRVHIGSGVDYRYKVVEFEVSRTIIFQLNDIQIYDKLLDQIVKIGVKDVSNLRAIVTDADSLYQVALQQAVKNAQQKAKQLAKAAGIKLGKVVAISERSYFAPVLSRNMTMMAEAKSVHQSQPGEQQITAEVNVKIAILSDQD